MKRMMNRLACLVAIGLGVMLPVAVSGSPSVIDLGGLTGAGDQAFALAINERGQIVGWSATPSQEIHAVLWQDGMVTDLGTLPGDNLSWAMAINDRGQIVGFSGRSNRGYLEGHAF